MKLAHSARHLEVQVLADNYGNCISVFGRSVFPCFALHCVSTLPCSDCSVQRRHQKIIEEGPAAIAPPEIFSDMEKCAIRCDLAALAVFALISLTPVVHSLAKMVGYVSTGTIEYLYNAEKKTFNFLELNPRLQVGPCPAPQRTQLPLPLHLVRSSTLAPR